jgi:endonuclease/exonuclease/phosphatase (EEP) superfamily protein YafD
MAELCLTILCPPNLEEKLLDMLLISPEIALFTSASAAAHGASTHQMSATEQVLGRAFTTQIQVLFDEANKEKVLNTIRQQFSGTSLRYWITPILERGEFT